MPASTTTGTVACSMMISSADAGLQSLIKNQWGTQRHDGSAADLFQPFTARDRPRSRAER